MVSFNSIETLQNVGTIAMNENNKTEKWECITKQKLWIDTKGIKWLC